MESQTKLFKGELMEELLRNYFLSLGFYVARGVEYKFEGNLVTDIDLFLYGRSSTLSRERIIVEIKNKKKPQAFERILVVNGLKSLLKLNGCIVATTDQKDLLHKFGNIHDTHILDGAFLSKLKSNNGSNRLYEEELMDMFAKHKSHKTFPNKDWRALYQLSKSRLLSEQDFSGFNEGIYYLEYFINKSIVDVQKREEATRMIYVLISHLLLTLDYISKDIAFLDSKDRENRLLDGFNFGNLGKNGVDRIIEIAGNLAQKPTGALKNELERNNNQVLKDYFSKLEIAKNLHLWAKEFELCAYNRLLISPTELQPHLLSVISIFLDYFLIQRTTFFNSFIVTSQVEENLEIVKETPLKKKIKDYRVLGVLKNEQTIEDLGDNLFKRNQANISKCIEALSKVNAPLDTVIYVFEKGNKVSTTLPNGTVKVFS
ncbi:MAG: hypothetical protein J0L86_04660 [Flavobacteriales bacterium]|nr:hypothetical protein [Flavobacteriales bacterium]